MFTPEQWTMIITAGITTAGAFSVAMLKVGWSVFKAWRIGKTEREDVRKSLSEIDPKLALPFAIIGAGALAALLGSGATMLADARKPRPVHSKCGPDCADDCKCVRGQCRCASAPSTTSKPKPRISAGELASVTTYAGDLSACGGFW